MAQQTTIEFVDDLTGGKAVGTVRFALDGTSYEIDLNKKNDAALRKALAEFIAAGRVVRTTVATPRVKRAPSGKSSPRVPADRKEKLSAIRAWAQENGIQVAERGRIAAEIEKQFDDANAGRPAFSDS